MEQGFYRRLGLLPAILALAAIAIQLGLGTHGHHNDCHDFCWVCHSSVADIGLPAETAVFLVIWSTQSVANDFALALRDFDANLHTAPRAAETAEKPDFDSRTSFTRRVTVFAWRSQWHAESLCRARVCS